MIALSISSSVNGDSVDDDPSIFVKGTKHLGDVIMPRANSSFQS